MAPDRREDAHSSTPPDTTAAPDPPPIHPSFIQVAKPYIFEQTIQQCIAAMGVNPLREESLRLQGVTWVDNVRRNLNLPIRTFNTAVVYYHKFRLVHPDNEYNYNDAATAALFTACKVEDTLKRSRELVCAAYNLKVPPQEHLAPDSQVFDLPARGIIGLERLMLESSGFDFRTRHPQKTLVKLARKYGLTSQSEVSTVAYRIAQDLYRTYAPIKQTTSTMAFSALELAGRLLDQRIPEVEAGVDYKDWNTSREEVMETLLDILELYTHNRAQTTVGPHFPADRFLTVRIPLNSEAEEKKLPRYTHWVEPKPKPPPAAPRGPKGKGYTNGTSHNSNNGSINSHTLGNSAADKDKPDHPLTPVAANGDRPRAGEKYAVRFMLEPDRAEVERARVEEYFRVEVEEYEVEE
ncbi:putative cyclin [Aspergillus saccharolyticus JOP 1030-1]|uniref:RNA polymerase II holoenzyme cyclin-like subunit n=1 Tax=Aspergillus saccharolyticus JOP 1030-1 TaxID=1450539 RepID=A0A318Z5Q3_9EURO|nr:cyclin-like protein [Aspergillus saccharolyticus JOP 1030-1]PYH42641.1 cyclin-like protein [Aspergillus saccharolyticus JOP 1030-1]